MSFYIGQEVICIDGSGWCVSNEYIGFWFWKKKKPVNGPAKDEICLIVGVHPENGYLYLRGYEQYGYYTPIAFRPLADISELEEILKQKEQA